MQHQFGIQLSWSYVKKLKGQKDDSSVGIMTSTLPIRSNGTNLTVRSTRTNFIKKSYSFSIQYKWNSLPTNIKNTKSLSFFKSLAYGHLTILSNFVSFICNVYLF